MVLEHIHPPDVADERIHAPVPRGLHESDKEMDAINMTRAEFHGEWNYTIHSGDRSDRAVDS